MLRYKESIVLRRYNHDGFVKKTSSKNDGNDFTL